MNEYKKYFVDSDEPIKIISLVREPIERNFSAFFQNLENFCDPNDKAATEGLISRFISDYNHKVPLEWFDVEMKTTTGIDVYSKEFMYEEGYQLYKEGRYELLVLRVDMNDQTKEELVARFMGLDSFKLTMKNIGSKNRIRHSIRISRTQSPWIWTTSVRCWIPSMRNTFLAQTN